MTSPNDDLVGQKVSHFRVGPRLGAGGTGAVYEAFDERLKRRVALKVLHGDRFSREARARFLREARILGRLDDPRICRIYDYLDDQNRDFLVLELVEGKTLEALLREGGAFPPARALHVALGIAEALARAHAEGVVHRDLKPSNVILGPGDQVKVLDFGIASSVEVEEASDGDANLEGDSRETALLRTRAGRIMGTLAYMSPEQARGEVATPATDIYAFGLLLQELFTGTRAHRADMPVPALLLTVARGETLPIRGLDRATTQLIERLKNPKIDERPTAHQALQDLRFIRDTPKRRLRRAIASALVLGLIGIGVKYTVDLRRERNAAIAAQRLAELARQDAEIAEKEANEVADFLVKLFEQSDPEEAQGRNVSARDILERGRRRIEKSLEGQKLTQARMKATIGKVYRELGDHAEAERLLKEALTTQEQAGARPLAIAKTLRSLAILHNLQGRFDEAEKVSRSCIALLETADDRESLSQTLNVLGESHRLRGADAEAITAYLRALEELKAVPAEELDDLNFEAALLNNLAGAYWRRDELENAEEMLGRSVEIEKRTLGPDHPRVGRAQNNLGLLALKRKDLDKAEDHFRQSLAIKEKTLGVDHPGVASTVYNLGDVMAERGDFGAAELLYRRAVALDQAGGGPNNPNVALSLAALAKVIAKQNRPEEAEKAFSRAAQIMQDAAAARPDRLEVFKAFADFLRDQGRVAEAEKWFEAAKPPPN